jgi:ATP-binding cassette subfamily B protein
MQTVNKIAQTVPRFMRHFLAKQWFVFALQFLLCFAWSAKESLFPFFIKNMINMIHINQPKTILLKALIWQGVGLLLLWSGMEIAMRWQGFLAMRSFPKFRTNIQAFLFNYMKGHAYDYFNTHTTGSLAAKITELPRACENLLEILLLHLTSISGAVTIGIILLSLVDGRFAGLFLLWLLLHIGVSFYFAKSCYQAAEKYADTAASLNGKIIDALTNILNILLYARGQYEFNYLKKFQREELQEAKCTRWALEKVKIYQSIFATLYMIVMLYCLIAGWFYNIVSVGDFVLVPMLSFSLLGMVWWLSNQIHIIFREVGIIKSGLQLINTEHQIQDKKDAFQLSVYQGEISFQDVTFQYPKGQKVFEKISLQIPARQKIGLVGLSGAGKSTFIKLLLRLYDLNDGSIFIDSQNIAEVTQDSLHEQIAVIPQDLSLFHRTLYENIQYGCLEATEEATYKAAQLSGCHEFIQQLPQGYQTLVGEKGIKLSGGQRQRIAIARAILKNAPILILDEATSSLDSMTESAIQTNLYHFMQNKTVIIIAHRISTLDRVDRILVFEEGKIVGDGNKEVLLQTNHYFKQLYAMQYAGMLPIDFLQNRHLLL